MPRRVQRKRTKGWRMPANTLYVGRPSRWGNPFDVESYGRERSMVLYRNNVLPRLDLTELRGKNLACWCSLDDEPCHADILLEAANR